MAVVGSFLLPHPPAVVMDDIEGNTPRLPATVRAMRQVAASVAALKPDVVVLVAPHATVYSNYMLVSPGKVAKGYIGIPDAVEGRINDILLRIRPSMFAKGSVRVAYDEDFAKSIVYASRALRVPAGTEGQKRSELDFSAVIPLYFITAQLPDCPVVRCSVSGLPLVDHYRFGRAIAKAARDAGKRVVVVASGSLSHRLDENGAFGFAPEAPLFDDVVTEALGNADFLTLLKLNGRLCERVGEAASRPMAVMAGSLDRQAVNAQMLSYESAGGVGHAVASFQATGSSGTRAFEEPFKKYREETLRAVRKAESAIVKLARLHLETYVKTDVELKPDDAAVQELVAACQGIALQEKGSVFVTLRVDEKLRGCFGRVEPKKDTLIEELFYNVLGAAYEDPRFEGVSREDLPNLTYEVDVLQHAEKITAEEELDPRRYGVNAYVPKRKREGYVLADPLSLKTPREQVEIALKKGSIDDLEQYALEKLETKRYV